MSQKKSYYDENDIHSKTRSVLSFNFNRKSIQFNKQKEELGNSIKKFQENNKKILNVQNIITSNTNHSHNFKEFQGNGKSHSTRNNTKNSFEYHFKTDIYSNYIGQNINKKENKDLNYLKNTRNEEDKMRKLIKNKKNKRLELINTHHQEILKEKFLKSEKGLLITNLYNQNKKIEKNLDETQSKIRKIDFSYKIIPKNENNTNLFENKENNEKIIYLEHKNSLNPDLLNTVKSVKFVTIDPDPPLKKPEIFEKNKQKLKRKRIKMSNIKESIMKKINRSISHFNPKYVDLFSKSKKNLKNSNYIEIFKKMIFNKKDILCNEDEISEKEKSSKKKSVFFENRFFKNLLNNSDDESIKKTILNNRESENIYLLRRNFEQLKNTIYQIENEMGYSEDFKEGIENINSFHRMLLKITSLLRPKNDKINQFVGRMKSKCVLKNCLEIKNEHIKQIDEFYQTKIENLDDMINTLNKGKDFFENKFIIKYQEYNKFIFYLNELEKQNLKKIIGNYNENVFEIKKLKTQQNKMRERLKELTEYRNFMICVKERKINSPTFFTGKNNSQEELTILSKEKIKETEIKIFKKFIELKNLLEYIKTQEKEIKSNIQIKRYLLSKNISFELEDPSKNFTESSNIYEKMEFEINKSNDKNDSNNSKFTPIKINTVNLQTKKKFSSTHDSFKSLFDSKNKKGFTSKHSNKISDIFEENKKIETGNQQDNGFKKMDMMLFTDAKTYIDLLELKVKNLQNEIENYSKERLEFIRYYQYLNESIFKSFSEFNLELIKLERDNIAAIEELNDKKSIFHQENMSLFQFKNEENKSKIKFQKDLYNVNILLNDAKDTNKHLKERINFLMIDMKKSKFDKGKSKKIKNFSFPQNLKSKSSLAVLPMINTKEHQSENSSNIEKQDKDIQNVNEKKIKEMKRPNFFYGVLKIFDLICEDKPFKNFDILKNSSFEVQILLMLQHIESKVNELLSRVEYYKQNPYLTNELTKVFSSLEKENRARKARENKMQVLEDHKNMIDRVNYKFFRLNVLPKRKCPGRFKPIDRNKRKEYLLKLQSLNKKKKDMDQSDFLDIND